MAALPYIQLYIADYLADTAHLDVTASGAYLHLIMNYWQTGKPLKNCDTGLARTAKCFNGEWEIIKHDVKGFFVEGHDGLLYHSRIDADLQRVVEKGAADAQESEWKGYIYFISNTKTARVKIGLSKNPWARVKDLQSNSSDKLLLVATVKTTELPYKKVVAELAEYLIDGDWYGLSPLIESLILAIKTKKITTVEATIDYCQNYGSTTVATTKDTDTDTDNILDINNTALAAARAERRPAQALAKTSVDNFLADFDYLSSIRELRPELEYRAEEIKSLFAIFWGEQNPMRDDWLAQWKKWVRAERES